MAEKRRNRKGQEGMSITTLLALVLGVVVVVIIILGFTGSFDFIFGKVKLLPGQALQTVVKSCETSVELNLNVDYCSFKKIKIVSKNEYLNCMDSRVQSAMKADLVGKINCPNVNIRGVLYLPEKAQCVSLIESKQYNVKVNGIDIKKNISEATDYCTKYPNF